MQNWSNYDIVSVLLTLKKESMSLNLIDLPKMQSSKTTYSRRVHNCRLLSVTKYLMSFRNCDWQNEMRRKLFVSEKGLFFEIQLEWLNLHVLEACLPEKHAFIVCKAFKTTHILKSLRTSIFRHTPVTCCHPEPQCAVANITKRIFEQHRRFIYVKHVSISGNLLTV